MSEASEKSGRIQSPPYPNVPLPEAVKAAGKIESRYRSSTVDRLDAAKLLGYAGSTGPSNMALAALALYGLVERVGKGEIRVTELARSILHPMNDAERNSSLRQAALSPQLFRDLRERFADVPVPPEEGVATYLNRRGFNPSAVRPAARAFLHTMTYVQQLGEGESNGAPVTEAQHSDSSPGKPPTVTFGGARVGDLIQWESGGVLYLERPMRVRLVTPDEQWVAVEGSETGIPMSQVIVEDRAAPSQPAPIRSFPLATFADDSSAGTDLRFKLSKDTVVKVRSAGELDADALTRLLKLLEAQRDALRD